MTSVYSGGLVYEYSQEDSNYGLVTLNGNSVSTNQDFDALKSAYQKTANPSGDGGYKTNGGASACPSKSSTWNVTMNSNQLPAMPSGASDLFKGGAGTGPGLSGSGSQTSGSPQVTLADAASGTVTNGSTTGSSSSSKTNAASSRFGEISVAAFVSGAVVLVSALL